MRMRHFAALCLVLALTACAQPAGLPPEDIPDGKDAPVQAVESAGLTENALALPPEYAAYEGTFAFYGLEQQLYAIRDDGTLWYSYHEALPDTWKQGPLVWAQKTGVQPKIVLPHGWAVFAIDTDNVLWSWSADETHIAPEYLGRECDGDYTTPGVVMTNVRQALGGFGFMAALQEDGSLWLWGRYKDILKERPPVSLPQQIMEEVFCISTEGQDLFALRRDGTLWIIKADMLEEGPPLYKAIQIADDADGLEGAVYHTKDGQYRAAGYLNEVYPIDIAVTYEGAIIDTEGHLRFRSDPSILLGENGAFAPDMATYIDTSNNLWRRKYEPGDEFFLLDEDVVYAVTYSRWVAYVKSDGTLWTIKIPPATSERVYAPELLLDHMMLP